MYSETYSSDDFQTISSINDALRTLCWPDSWFHPDNWGETHDFLWENVARAYIERNYEFLREGKFGLQQI